MDVGGTPFQYGGAVDASLLSEAEDCLYLALKNGGAVPKGLPSEGHIRAQSLFTIAERLECDTQVARLKAHGVECRAGYGDHRDADFHAVAACVTLYVGTRIVSVNAAAACRMANRLDSKLALDVAFARTLKECVHAELSRAGLRQLEREANAWVRALDRIDKKHEYDLGSPAHREEIRQAEMKLP